MLSQHSFVICTFERERNGESERRERQRCGETEVWRDGEEEMLRGFEMERQRYGETERQIGLEMERLRDGRYSETGRRGDRETDRRGDGEKGRLDKERRIEDTHETCEQHVGRVVAGCYEDGQESTQGERSLRADNIDVRVPWSYSTFFNEPRREKVTLTSS